MRELNVNELEQVNGGIAPMAVMAGAHLLKSLGLAYRVYSWGKRAAG